MAKILSGGSRDVDPVSRSGGVLKNVLRLWRTVRWLRPEQILGRAWFRLYQPNPDFAPAPGVRPCASKWMNVQRQPSLTGPHALHLLGQRREIATAADWNRVDWPKLWRYNAHYFDDLAAVEIAERVGWQKTLVARWVEENPAGGGVGWDPYPTSLRIVNWIKWGWAGNPLDAQAVHSLAVQTRWLCKRLEWHLLGNHLWANAKALVFAGSFFEGEEADIWLRKGLSLIDRELREQVLDDGGHFELSPMYHAIILEDLLDLVQLGQVYPLLAEEHRIAQWRTTAKRMLQWLRTMTHPDGEIAFFNDATWGVAPQPFALEEYAARLGIEQLDALDTPLHWLRDSGYARAHCGPATVIADVGMVGPDYLPGHAHADTLSFELSLERDRVLVNSGISLYESGVERLRQRGTAAHNTLQIDGENSSEVWSSFRVGRRAKVHGVEIEADADGVRVAAEHDGYAWRRGKPMHRREWVLSPHAATVSDTISGLFETAEVRFHLHPDWSIVIEDETQGWLNGPRRRIRWQVSEQASARAISSTWHPGFGTSLQNQVLVVTLREGRLDTSLSWE